MKRTHSDQHCYPDVIKSIERPKDRSFLRADSFYNLVALMNEAKCRI
jgi:hypothetical protein